MVVILMGVSGCGKTTLGLRLAADLGWTFIDADDFHSDIGLARMANGEPQSADDLKGWIRALRTHLASVVGRGESAVLACSALTSGQRTELTVDSLAVRFVYLKGSASLVRRRLRNRSGHFLREHLLESQFAALEEPLDAVTIDIDDRPGRIVEQIRMALSL